MINLSPALLREATRCSQDASLVYAPALDAACREFRVCDTPEQVAMMIAQMAVETARFTAFKEDMTYRNAGTLMKIWPSRFPSLSFALQYVAEPAKLADYVYCNRMGNGNIASGDGSKFIGRGGLMLTGRGMYEAYQRSTQDKIMGDPEQLAKPRHAMRSAAWFWRQHGFDDMASAGGFMRMTIALNGGLVGYDDGNRDNLNDRLDYLKAARDAIAAATQGA